MRNKTEDFFSKVHKRRLAGSYSSRSAKRQSINFAEYIRWEILKRYLQKDENIKILEVGSAPGYNLIKMHKTLGYIPYGVENSKSGVLINKKIFRENGLDENNIIYSDFFDDTFQRKYKDFFDVCFSHGFLEHFENPSYTIDCHLNLLKKGGFLIITIPNFRYVNYLFIKLFSPHLVDIHNLKIMDLNSFSKLFNNPLLKSLFCRYYGGFNFGLFYAEKGTLRRRILKFCKKWLQSPINKILFTLYFSKFSTIECKFSSPYVMYIGKKI